MKSVTDDQVCRNSVYVSLLSLCLSVLLLTAEHNYWSFFAYEINNDGRIVIFVLSIVFLVLASGFSLMAFVFGVIRSFRKENLKTVIPLSCVMFFQFLFLMLNIRAVDCVGVVTTGGDTSKFINGVPGQGLTITLVVFAGIEIILSCVFIYMLNRNMLPESMTPAHIAKSLDEQSAAYNAAKAAPKTDDKFCPYCGAKLIGSGKFCPNCGKDVSAFREEEPKFFCPGCGTAIKKYSAYCPNCGYDLSSLKDKMNVSDGAEAEEKTSE